ncbi:MAG: luciferase family protein [Cenarchaeum symbiont of Oopsacas minuta]|nr:luciferase family protein [Cenarchaeum symbiont of Oopsacas minuta]
MNIDEVLECATYIDRMKNQPDTIWIPETWGMENFATVAAVSQRAHIPRIGSSIINVYSRTPALVAMGSVTIDKITDGRFVLGLGASSKPIVERFHGVKYTMQLDRMREYIDIIRLAFSGKRIDYDGNFFKLRGFKLLSKSSRASIPIYIAAVNKKMVDLCWQIGDGVIFYLRPLEELKNTLSHMQTTKKIDVACQIITAVSNDSEKAAERVKTTLAFYVAVGAVYRDFLAKNGFKEEVCAIYEQYKKTGLDNLHQTVPEKMIRSLAIFGSADECFENMKRFYNAGIDLPIVQFNPVGDVMESFKLAHSAFTGGDRS